MIIDKDNIIPAFMIINYRRASINNNTLEALKPSNSYLQADDGKESLIDGRAAKIDAAMARFLDVSISTIARYKRHGFPAHIYILIDFLLLGAIDDMAEECDTKEEINKTMGDLRVNAGAYRQGNYEFTDQLRELAIEMITERAERTARRLSAACDQQITLAEAIETAKKGGK